MSLDLKAVEALDKQRAEVRSVHQDAEWSRLLRNAAPELLALAKIGLAALAWQKTRVTVSEFAEDVDIDSPDLSAAIDRRNDARLAFEAVVLQHQSGGV